MALVVWTADLVKILEEFKENGYIPEALRKRINNFLNEAENKPLTLFFEEADRLVTAIGKSHLFNTETLTVFSVKLSPAVILLGKPALRKRRWAAKNKPRKRCLGLFCQGQARPLSKFNINKSGRDEGKPRTYCVECDLIQSRRYQERWKLRNRDFYEKYYRERNIKRRKNDWQHYGLVPYGEVRAAVEELCSRLSFKRVALRIGVATQTVWRWRKGLAESIHLEYAVRIQEEYSKVILQDERLTPAEKRFGKGVRIEIERGELGLILTSRRVKDEETTTSL